MTGPRLTAGQGKKTEAKSIDAMAIARSPAEWAKGARHKRAPGTENQPVPTDEIEKLIYLRVSCSCGLVSRDLFSDTDSRSGLVPDPSGLVRSRRTGTDAKIVYGCSAKGLMRSLFSPYAVFILTLCGLHSHPMRSPFSPYAVSILTLWGPILISCAHPHGLWVNAYRENGR
jgi:hypothetical protein